MSLDEITAYLHAHIPVTRSLGAAAVRWDGATLGLRAPLAPNLNHRGTAFGGSMSAGFTPGGGGNTFEKRLESRSTSITSRP